VPLTKEPLPCNRWYEVKNVGDVPSPSLLVYVDRVAQNIRTAIQTAGDVKRLRPHVKTHKLAEIVRMHLELGVTKFKCATIAEAEMTAIAGAKDILLAYQPVGPTVERIMALVRQFPHVLFSVVADDASVIDYLAKASSAHGTTLNVFLDVNCGMNRTGVPAGEEAAALYRRISSSPGLRAAGLHAYDGHIHDTDVHARRRSTEESFALVAGLKQELEANDLSVPAIVAGGTPTFPFHAARGDVESSPGTYVFWDFGYAETMPDLPFQIAAVLLTRVVSKPGINLLCLDLGHKAVAPESPAPRVKFFDLPDATAVMHSEEHLVIETSRASELRVGDVLYGVPRHICPTVALHSEVTVIRDGRAEERWKVVARDRALTI